MGYHVVELALFYENSTPFKYKLLIESFMLLVLHTKSNLFMIHNFRQSKKTMKTIRHHRRYRLTDNYKDAVVGRSHDPFWLT